MITPLLGCIEDSITVTIDSLKDNPDYIVLVKEFQHGTYEIVNHGHDSYGHIFSAAFLVGDNGHLIAMSGNTVEEVLRRCLEQHTAALWDKCLDVSVDRKIAKACSQAAI